MSNKSRYLTSGLLVVAAAVWFRVNSPVEGPVLISVSYNHGFTVADLLSVALVVAAAWLAGSTYARARRQQRLAAREVAQRGDRRVGVVGAEDR